MSECARFWKRAAKRYRQFLSTRWTETCAALNTEAITAERDYLRARVAQIEAASDTGALTELADAALARRIARRAFSAANEVQVVTQESHNAAIAASIARDEVEHRFAIALDAYEKRKREATGASSNKPDAFDSAEYYDYVASNTLTHETPADAIEAYLKSFQTLGLDMTALIDNRCPIAIGAFRRRNVADGWIEHTAKCLLELAEEWFADEYGVPDAEVGIDKTDHRSALPAMKAAIKQIAECGNVNACEVVAERDFDADQVTAMMRERRPEWFELGEGGT